MSVLLALALVSANPPESSIGEWLDRPEVRLLAVASVPETCEGCEEESGRWQVLARAHHARGLRTIAIVGRHPALGCIDPGWKPDAIICDVAYDGIAKRWNLRERRSTAFLWSWKGELIVSHGDLPEIEHEVERRMKATLPLVVVQGGWPGLREALAASNKYRPAPEAIERPRLEELRRRSFAANFLEIPRCEMGRGLAGDAILGARTEPGRIELALRSEEGCLLATGPSLDALFGSIRRTIEMPSLKQRPTDVASLRDPIAKRLAARIERDLGRTDLDGASFVRAVLLDTFRIDVGATKADQLESGPEVLFDLRDPDRALRPGDLVFYVTYGYVPKVVLLYLDQGLVAEVADIRGVVIGPLPRELPLFFRSVARRPLTYTP